MNRKLTLRLTTALVVVFVFSLFIALKGPSNTAIESREFYVGVEFAYGNSTAQVEALVDKVKNYTNLFVIGAIELTFNETALTEVCDYIYEAKLNFIIQFKGLQLYDYNITDWMQMAQQRYGTQFLGVYRYDEPGGRQLDGDSTIKLLNNSITHPNATYQQVTDAYVGNLSYFPDYYLQYAPEMFTADYALYWFDYKAGYSAVFGEFVGIESRARHIGLCRGAATAFDRDWGIIVTWKYDGEPYLESGEELYNDLVLAYSAGAKYAVVFSYPEVSEYGILTKEHFDALEQFWNTLSDNPESFGENTAEVAYVVPRDYGFGFRSPNDTIWGLFPADANASKIYNDVVVLTERYGAKLDILYDGPESFAILGNYSIVYYWNQTIT